MYPHGTQWGCTAVPPKSMSDCERGNTPYETAIVTRTMRHTCSVGAYMSSVKCSFQNRRGSLDLAPSRRIVEAIVFHPHQKHSRGGLSYRLAIIQKRDSGVDDRPNKGLLYRVFVGGEILDRT